MLAVCSTDWSFPVDLGHGAPQNAASLWRQGNGISEWFPTDIAQKKVIFLS